MSHRPPGAQSTAPQLDDGYMSAFFDESARGPIYRTAARYCSDCGVRLSGYNRGSTCYTHTPAKAYRAIVSDKKPILEKYHGKPCRVCGGTLRYGSGSCVVCVSRAARKKQEGKKNGI
jgi:hypothetical protein